MATYTSQDVEKNKVDVAQVEYLSEDASQKSRDAILEQFTPGEQKKIMRKIDRRLVPLCGLLYCISLLDRTNLGAANIAG